MELLLPKFNYILYVVLMMTGLWGMIAKQNLVKKIIGMAIFQTSIILLYVSTSVKSGATIPILEHHADPAALDGTSISAAEQTGDLVHGALAAVEHGADPALYMNPLPHVLMLTAIVVGVGTLGVALALVQLVYKQYGTLEEEDIIARIDAEADRESGS
jgi:multicomponent Na+:H+ antiporter subunit C